MKPVLKQMRLITIALLLAVATGILALGPRSGKSIPSDRVVVDYWEKWTGQEEKQMRAIVDDFNQMVGAEKKIYVNYVSTSNITQKTLVACAAGVPPDVAGLWSRNLIQFALVGALEPLEERARAYGITEASYKPICWKACSFDGHLYALVSTPASVALIYNKKLFAQSATELRAAGLDPDRAPRTIDELDAYARVLTKLDERGRFIVAGYLPTEPGWYLDQTHLWFGGSFWDAKNKRFTLTDERVVKAYEWVQSYSTRYGKQATSDFRSGAGHYDSPQNPFLAGKVAMVLQGPWMANVIYKAKPGMSTVRWPRDVEMTKPLAERLTNYEWAAAPFPSAVPGLEDVSYCSLDVLVIPKMARHKKEAMEFIAYVNRQDVMEKLCKSHCKNTPLAKVSEDFLTQHPNPYIDVFERLLSSENCQSDPQIPILPQTYAEIVNIAQRLTLQQTTAGPALAEAQQTLQAKFDGYESLRAARGK